MHKRTGTAIHDRHFDTVIINTKTATDIEIFKGKPQGNQINKDAINLNLFLEDIFLFYIFFLLLLKL